ncbi:hypothetical protein BGP75_05420 [Motiliproteus sp. MSK22-1]|nr:hypothetical protein BGP75_05420 [Motiliproteus sp. MSK22-1]
MSHGWQFGARDGLYVEMSHGWRFGAGDGLYVEMSHGWRFGAGDGLYVEMSQDEGDARMRSPRFSVTGCILTAVRRVILSQLADRQTAAILLLSLYNDLSLPAPGTQRHYLNQEY